MSSTRPNVILIHTDQQRADTLGCYGNAYVKTPNIDGLAQSGVVFENAFCTHPLCSPARASWITGEYIHSHGLWRNGTALSESRDNVVKSLSRAGYDTVSVGKVHLTPYHGDPEIHPEAMQLDNDVRTPTPEECWDYWRNQHFENGYFGYKDVRMAVGHGDYGISGGHYGLWVHEQHPETVPLFFRENAISDDHSYDAWKSNVPLEVHSSTWITNQVEDYLSHNDGTPFFLSVGFQEPHPPFQPPKPYCDMYDPDELPDPVGDKSDWGENPPDHLRHYLTRQGFGEITAKRVKEIIALYYGMVTLVDDAVGRIIDSLKKHGVYDNTLIIFTSDHGDWMGDHGLNRKGAVHTRGLIRIPMIIKWPGVSKAGLRVTKAASQVDLAATIYDACGVRPHYTNQGLSMRRVLSGETDAVRPYALIEHCHEHYLENGKFEQNVFGNVPKEKRREVIQEDIINHLEQDILMKTVVTDSYRFTYVPALGYGELYDWRTDAQECHNLYGEGTQLQAEAEKMLLLALTEASPRCQERTFGV